LQAQRFDDVVIEPHKITDQIYLLKGAGGNIVILTGDEGTLMIDSQFGDISEKIKTAIADITDHAVKYLVNTHWHGDHTGGNLNFSNDGSTIIAHENVRARVSEDLTRPFRGVTPAPDKAAWPTITFGQDLSIYMNGKQIELLHMHNAHTDGDAFVIFPEDNVIHMGDIFFKDRFPFIDLDTGGSVDGYIGALEAALLIIDDETTIVPGHGNIANKDDLSRFLDMIKTVQERTIEQIKISEEDATLDHAELTEDYESWGDGFINSEKFIRTLQTDYSRKKEEK